MAAARDETGTDGPSLIAFWRKYWQWFVIATLAALSVYLGFTGFVAYLTKSGETPTTWRVLYLTLQLFTLESGAVESGASSLPIPWELNVARFMAPVVPAWAVLKALALLFQEQIQMFLLRFMGGHVVICGLGRKGIQLVRDFRRQGDRVVVIEVEDENDDIRTCLDAGATVLIGNAADKTMLERARVTRAKTVAALCGDDATNVGIGVATYELVRARGEEWGRGLSRALVRLLEFILAPYRLLRGRSPDFDDTVRCFVHVVDLALCAQFKRHRLFAESSERFEAQVFNIYENSARSLFLDRALDRGQITADSPLTVHLVILGFGDMGESVALQAAKIGHYANGKNTRITVVDHHALERERAFLQRYPEFDRVCDTTFLNGNALDPAIINKVCRWVEEASTATTVVVCLDDDPACLQCTLRLWSKLASCDVPILVRMIDDTGLGTLFEKTEENQFAQVHAFGMVDRICNPQTITNEDLDRVARAIHEDYVKEQVAKGTPETKPSMRPWHALLLDLKNSNRQQADHIPVKLRAVGCYSGPPEPGKPEAEFTDSEIELLAAMEHHRWNADRFLAGWSYGPEKNVERKLSPYLVFWEDLPDDVKKWDRDAVRNLRYLVGLAGDRIYRR